MEDIFGKITAGLILVLIPIIVQAAKEHFAWDDKQSKVAAFILSASIAIPWHVLDNAAKVLTLPDKLAVIALLQLILEAVLYALLVWVTVTGAYHLGVKPVRERMLRQIDADGFPR